MFLLCNGCFEPCGSWVQCVPPSIRSDRTMPVPVWAALLAVAVAKKVVVFTAAKIYGFPRLYRKQQQLARWFIRDKATLKAVSGRIGYLYRAPNTLSARLFGPKNPSAPFSTEGNGRWRPVQELKALQTKAFLKPSFASSTVMRSAPAACSKGLLADTLRSGQQFFRQRGCSVQRLPSQSVVSHISVSTPAAASALHRLGKPFNFVMGHSS